MSQQQQGVLSKYLQQEKKTFYQLTYQLVNRQFNVYVYYVLVIIEHIQIIAYQCHSAYDYNNIATDWFRTFTHFLNPQYYLKKSHLMDYFVPLTFILVTTHAGLFFYSYYRHAKKGINKIQSKNDSFLLLTHYATVIMVTVFTTPIFLSSLLAFYCHQANPYHPDRQCYNTYHLFIILLSFFNLIWMTAINLYFFLFYYTRNSFAYKNFLSLSSSLWNLLKFTLKVVPAGYLIFDQILQFKILFVFGVAAGLLGYTAISRVLYPYTRYNKHIQKVMIYIEITFITVSLLFILQAFFTEQEGSNLSFLVSFIIGIPLSKLAFEMLIKKEENTILQMNKYDKDNTQTLELLLTYMIFLIEDNSTPANAKRLFKMIKFHNDKCHNVQCGCYQYLEKQKDDQEYFMNRDLIYKIFLEVIDRCMTNNKKAYTLVLLKSYIEYYRLGNGVKGSFIISKIMGEKIGFLNEYLIEGFMFEVSKNFEDTGAIETYRQFSEHLIRYEKEAMKLASLYYEFWQQISQQNSSLKKVMNLLLEAKRSKVLVDQQFQTLSKIYPKNIRIVEIYKQLYKEVIINYEEFIKYNKMHAQNFQGKEQSRLVKSLHQIKFTANQDLLVINSSLKVLNDIYHGGCEILSVTNNVYKLLGYAAQDLVGKNINRFLPKIYLDFHDQLINHYLTRDTPQLKPRELLIFPINSNGNLVHCAMTNKIMPSLQYGLNIISFILNTEFSKPNLIIYDQRTGLVDSMTKEAQTFLLGKKYKKTSISIPDHISDILPVWDYLKQQQKQLNKKGSQQFHLSFKNVQLYRSDGPVDSQHVKVVSFELAFDTKLSSMKECMIQNDSLQEKIQKYVENTSQKVKLTERQNIQSPIGLEDNKSGLRESPSMILPKLNGRKSIIVEDIQPYEALSGSYTKIYLILQVLMLLGVMITMVYSYVLCLGYFDSLGRDLEINQNIIEAMDSLLEQSHTASKYIFSQSDAVIKSNLNIENSTSQLKQLISIGQLIYQELVKKEDNKELHNLDIMVDVQYFTSSNTIIVKSQTVTDATYQFSIYLLEIYQNSAPLKNLPNNVLFVANNCMSISDKFVYLNQILTKSVLINSHTRKEQFRNIVIAILIVFFISIIWQTIYKLAVDSKVNQVIQVYEAIPIQELYKCPIKCQNFIKTVSPVKSSTINLQNNIQSVRKLENDLQYQNTKKYIAPYQGSVPLQDEEDIEYISFNTSPSLKHIIIQSLIFLIIFSSFFILQLNSQNGVINQNLSQVIEWNKITSFRSELIKTLYLINQHKNRSGQWNFSQIAQIDTMFRESLKNLQKLLKSTKALDPYLSVSYQLIEEAVFIANNDKVTSQHFIINERKFQKVYNQIKVGLINNTFEKSIKSNVSEFLGINQLIFVGQIILFLLYAVVYIPKSYITYRDRNILTQMMYETLGQKLQNIAKKNHKHN